VNRTTPASTGLPFEVCRFVAEDGQELEAWHVPHPWARGVVVLCHGYAACKATMLRPARVFHELGFATLLVDFRGSGGSDGNITTIGVREAADVVAAYAFARQRAKTGPMILFGTSMGAAAILRAVARSDLRPDALILECPFDRLLHTVENRCSLMGVPGFPTAHLLLFWGGVQCGFDGFDHNPVEYAAAVRCPVLLMHGENDPTVSAAQARAIFDNLGGEKQFELLSGVRHESFAAARPELWKKLVSQFLDRQCAAQPQSGLRRPGG
jgi:alpha-beta hydrolase superfamily lysophospholipase